MDPDILNQMTSRISELLADKLEAKGARLDKQIAFARRQLPARARKAGAVLIEAQQMAQAPQLAMKIDVDAVNSAHKVMELYLTEFDAEADKSRKRYNRWSAIAGQFLLVSGVMLGLLWWVEMI